MESPPRKKQRLVAEAEIGPASDLLSSLPLEVLDKILSRLHIYEVVRTSVLSRAWRRRWETLPTVNLISRPIVAVDEVDALLLRRTAPIRTFRLIGCGDWYVDALHDWLLYLSRNGVQTLTLWFPPEGFRLHSSLFSCRELTSLNLTHCRLPTAPAGFAGFPSLKTLRFSQVSIPEHGGKQLAALIAASPLIESVELSLVELIGDDPEDEDEWVIRAPNLRGLKIASRYPYGGRVEDLPLLQKGVLVGCNCAKFLIGMSRITELQFACVAGWSAEVDVLDRLPFLFENLRSLVITVDFTEMSAILSFFCLLRSAPVLEELLISGWSNGSQVFNADDNFFNAQWVDSMFAKLRVVQMKDILCFSNEMSFMEFILSKARVLQVISVRFGPNALCSNEAVLALKEYTKASPDAQVILLGMETANTEPINTSTENAEVEDVQTAGREHDSSDTPAENAEVDEQILEGKRGSITTSTETDKAEEESKHGSITTFTENDKAEETQTTGSKHKSISTSAENAEVEERQTTGSELVNDVRPRRRQLRDLESVALLEELKELKEIVQLERDRRRCELQNRTRILDNVIWARECQSLLKTLSERDNIGLPPFPEPSSVLSSLLAASRTGDSPVSLGVNGAASAHLDSSEDHGVNGTDNAHPDPQGDRSINGAVMAQVDSSEHA